MLPTTCKADGATLVTSLRAVTEAISAGSSLWLGTQHLHHTELRKRFEAWVPSFGLRDWYDVFVSYRWTQSDTDFVTKLYDCFRYLSIEGRRVEVFLDRERLQAGRRFDKDFVAALVTSRLAVPIVSRGALERMARLTSTSPVDNLLIEWMVMAELQELGSALLVEPVIMGQVQEYPGANVKISNLFDEMVPCPSGADPNQPSKPILDWLPEVIVDSVVSEVESMLKAHGYVPSSRLSHRTVRSTVKEICKNLGILCHQVLSECSGASQLGLTGLHQRCAGKIYDSLLTAPPLPASANTDAQRQTKPTILKHTETVGEFLERNNLGRFAPHFEEHGYGSIRVLFEISEQSLAELGMKSGHIATFKLSLQSLLSEATGGVASQVK
eukprot:c40514_g1_i1.p1 GENE.c40514_g1_i1~~c40514_g1_i1.p1  ORF type:complete len:405 (+),score=77.36 c40514_g1_i1:65-1216(+)